MASTSTPGTLLSRQKWVEVDRIFTAYPVHCLARCKQTLERLDCIREGINPNYTSLFIILQLSIAITPLARRSWAIKWRAHDYFKCFSSICT